MGDVDEIIDFIKTLRKGFDKDLFQSKIDELAYIVDTSGLDYEEFHTLFKVWLNISLPVTKWVNLGSCLAPPDIVEKRTVEYALRWILVNFHDQANFSRVGFLLDWLTVAMEYDCIDMAALDVGYDVFYTMLTFEVLAVHAMKLVYTLTKPVDVTRKRVLDLIKNAKIKEGQKSIYKPLQVLLMLFKSYRPECVPEDIPAIPIYTALKKMNKNLLTRFRMTRERKSINRKSEEQLTWINSINCGRGNKKAEPLVPNVEFVCSGRHTDGETANNILDFSDPASVLQFSVQRSLSRPARLRALLCNPTGQTLLAVHSHTEQAFLAHNLGDLLCSCFLEVSPYSYVEKQDLLQKLATFQRTLVQGIPAVTRFLAQYLHFWNGRDYFPEILELMEWVSVECPEHIQQISGLVAAAYLRAAPLEQCALVRSLTNMYTNLLYASTKSRQHFGSTVPSHTNYAAVLPELAAAIARMCHKGMQVDPEDHRVVYMSLWSARRRARAERAGGARGGAGSALALALPLLAASPALLDSAADLMILYRKIMSTKIGNEDADHIQMISEYLNDMLNCLYSEEALSGRQNGLLFKRLHPQLVDKLGCLMPDVDSKLSIRNHLAFAPYTYVRLREDDHSDADNKDFFHLVIEPQFPRLGLLMKKMLPELRNG